MEEEAEKSVGTKGGRKTPGKQGPLNQHEQISNEFTETEAACIGPTQVCVRSSAGVLELFQYFHGSPECVNEGISDYCACPCLALMQSYFVLPY